MRCFWSNLAERILSWSFVLALNFLKRVHGCLNLVFAKNVVRRVLANCALKASRRLCITQRLPGRKSVCQSGGRLSRDIRSSRSWWGWSSFLIVCLETLRQIRYGWRTGCWRWSRSLARVNSIRVAVVRILGHRGSRQKTHCCDNCHQQPSLLLACQNFIVNHHSNLKRRHHALHSFPGIVKIGKVYPE